MAARRECKPGWHYWDVDGHNIGVCRLCGQCRQFPFEPGERVLILKRSARLKAKEAIMVAKTETMTGIEMVSLELIDDNPFQPRKSFPRKDIDELAASIEQHGLRQIPEARPKGDRRELAYGHLRKTAFRKLQKKSAAKWGKMPLRVAAISDDNMFFWALEENMRHSDLKPLEVARAVDVFFTFFSDRTETELAKKLSMSQGHVSNMRRVVTLPDEILAKIDEGRISFTMGRELLVFKGITAGKYSRYDPKARAYVDHPKDEKYLMLEAVRGLGTAMYGDPATVPGIVRRIYSVASQHLRALEKVHASYRAEPLFDTREAGCLNCEHMIRTHPQKSQTAHYCANFECWDTRQQEHKERAATAALEQMRADVLEKVTAEIEAPPGGEAISQEIPPAQVSDQDLEAYERDLVQDKQDERAQRQRVDSLRNVPKDWPCHSCIKVTDCDRDSCYDEGDTMVCERQVTAETKAAVAERAKVEMPPEIRAQIQEKAGTRAEVLDVRELWADNYHSQLTQGHVTLDREIDRMADPQECLERCTSGFHFAFDSSRSEARTLHVCTKPKCVAQKKAAYTRARNAAGQTKKKAETLAIKQAVGATTGLDKARMKLIVKAQLEGGHVGRSYSWQSSDTGPAAWWWGKVVGTNLESQGIERSKIYAALDKLSDEDLARLIVDFMLSALRYSGDIQTYQVKTTEALNWMGIGVSVPAEAA